MARNKKGRNINGILLLDKASGVSSNYALQQVKHLFFAKKAGHTGSLDPIATGILPICLGETTKLANYLLTNDKSYQVVAKLGQTTTTLDSEGEITSKKTIKHITISKIKNTIVDFIGPIKQVPPMYSALKHNGIALYKLARNGIEIKRKARQITIFNINFIDYNNAKLTMEICCSKGTYIRSLVDDIGQKLDCGAHVIKLKRTKLAHFNLTNAITFKNLAKLTTNGYKLIDSKLIPSEDILPQFNNINLTNLEKKDINFGRAIICKKDNQIIKMFNNGIFLGIGEIKDNVLHPKRLFNIN